MRLDFRLFKYYPFGGLERNFLRITEECVRRGHNVRIYVASWEGPMPDFVTPPACSVVKVPVKGFSNCAVRSSYVRNVAKVAGDWPMDLIVGFKQMPGLDLYYAGDVCFAAEAKRKKLRAFRGLTSRERLFRHYERAVFSPDSNTMILELSHIQRDAYIREYGTPPDRFVPIPPGIDKGRIRSALDRREKERGRMGLALDDIMLLMVGSDFHRKGVERSVKALACLPETARTKTRLFVVGKGAAGRYKRLAGKLGVLDNVRFPGPTDDVAAYFAAADMLLHPALSENTGNTIVEALVAGLPVLTTSNCGYAFHVERADAGAVVEAAPFRQGEFNTKLSDLIADLRERREIWRANALDYSDKTDLYGRPSVTADIIERLVEKKKTS